MIDLIYDNGFKERFALLIKYFGTAANAAKLVGIAPDQIGRWRDGTARPAFFPIASLCVAAGVSIDWLATGVLKDADIIKDSIIDIPIFGIYTKDDRNNLIRNNFIILDRLPFNRDYLCSFGVDPKNVQGVYARGDSMLPTIADKNIVLVDTSVRDVSIGGIYSFFIGETKYIKRLQKQVDGSILLISDNNKYYPEQVIAAADTSSITIEGKAFFTERML